jgi:hypothetical protein
MNTIASQMMQISFMKTKVATNLHILKLGFYTQDFLQRYVHAFFFLD